MPSSMRNVAIFPVAVGLSLMTLTSTVTAQPRVKPVVVVPVPLVTPDTVVARQSAVLAKLKPDAARQLETAAREFIARVERALSLIHI